MNFLELFVIIAISLILNLIVNLYIGNTICFQKVTKYQLTQIISLFFAVIVVFLKINFTSYNIVSNIIVFILFLILIIITFVDYKTMIIPDSLIITMILLIIISKILRLDHFNQVSVFSSAIGSFIGFGLFYSIAYLSKGAMGGGDIKLISIMGLWLGMIDVVMITILAFIIGAIVSVLLIIFKIKNMKDAIPFGPFIVIASFSVFFFKGEIINFYFSLI